MGNPRRWRTKEDLGRHYQHRPNLIIAFPNMALCVFVKAQGGCCGGIGRKGTECPSWRGPGCAEFARQELVGKAQGHFGQPLDKN
jgi:hypothetical protein